MKKIYLFLLFIVNLNLSAQQQWKFYVAFEDATAARDTIWFIWDSTATFYGADTSLNEVSAHFDYSKFNVWAYNPGLTFEDSVKVIAFPYTYSIGGEIFAMNVKLPITITWDTSMLHASWLPTTPVGWVNFARIDNFYFFFHSINGVAQYDMTLSDSVTAPESWVSDSLQWMVEWHFPMRVYLIQDPTINTEKIDEASTLFNLFPNPFKDQITLNVSHNYNGYSSIYITDLSGKLLKVINYSESKINDSQFGSKIGILKPGAYLISLVIDGKRMSTIKLVKIV